MDVLTHGRSHKVTLMLKINFFFDIFFVQNQIYSKKIKNDNILKPRLSFLWTTFVLVLTLNSCALDNIRSNK